MREWETEEAGIVRHCFGCLVQLLDRRFARLRARAGVTGPLSSSRLYGNPSLSPSDPARRTQRVKVVDGHKVTAPYAVRSANGAGSR